MSRNLRRSVLGSILLIVAVMTVGVAVSSASVAAQQSQTDLGVELEQSATVSQGENVTVTAYVNNLGETNVTDGTAQLVVDSDGDGTFTDGEVVTDRTVSVAADEYRPVNLTYENVQLAAGEYEYQARMVVDGETTRSYTNGTLTVESATDGGDGAVGGGDDSTQNGTDDNETTTPKVELAPSSAQVTANSTTTFDLVLRNADGGVGAFDSINMTVANTDAATIDSISSDVSAGANTDVSSDGSEASVNVPFGGDTDNTGDVTLATVTVQVGDNGSTDLNVDVTGNIADESGQLYDNLSDAEGATVTVTGAPALVDDTPASDTDGDGKVDDFNGNNETDVGDVQALYNSRDSETVEQNADLFDYNGNGVVDIGDIQQLYTEAQASD
jgi:hypothetical protein